MKTTDAIATLEAVFRAGLSRVDPVSMMTGQIRLSGSRMVIDTGTEKHDIDLDKYKRVLVTGMGKYPFIFINRIS